MQHVDHIFQLLICIQNDRVNGELLVTGLCIKEPTPDGDFSSNYILSVCV